MNRRKIFASMLAAIGAPAAVAAATRARAAGSDGPKVVYHLCDFDKVGFALGNIENHFDGMGGADKVTIALAVHGPALKAFHAASARGEVKQRVDQLVKTGLRLFACANTMRSQHVAMKDLLSGFAAADNGAVVLIAELQSQGYAYIRP
jgi:intracellular sulfur oxidation DsrE/DsrF family protein